MKYVLLSLIFIPLQLLAPPMEDDYKSRIQSIIKLNQFIEKQRFIDDMAYSESRSNSLIVNSSGYIGLFQFGSAARRATGAPIITHKDIIIDRSTGKRYLKNDSIWPINDQYIAMDSLISINTIRLKTEIETYSGSVVAGIPITKSGILAAAHLAGYNNVKKFFKSNGKFNPHDCNSTSIKTYLTKFGNYNI